MEVLSEEEEKTPENSLEGTQINKKKSYDDLSNIGVPESVFAHPSPSRISRSHVESRYLPKDHLHISMH